MPDYSAFPGGLAALLRALSSAIDALMGRLERGEITLAQWRAEFAVLLASYIAAAFLAGSGEDTLTGDPEAWVVEWTAGQLDYLNGFEDAIGANIAAGGAWTAGYNARARMYAGSVVAPFWAGETWGLPLPAMPGDGSSDCGQMDACGWEIEWIDRKKGDADCFWRLNYTRIVATEHCQQCKERAVQWNPLRVRDWRLQIPRVNK